MYKPGGEARNNIDNMCEYCKDCSKYKTELGTICGQWTTIKSSWDFMPPTIPAALKPPMVDVDDTPKPEEPKGDWRNEVQQCRYKESEQCKEGGGGDEGGKDSGDAGKGDDDDKDSKDDGK